MHLLYLLDPALNLLHLPVLLDLPQNHRVQLTSHQHYLVPLAMREVEGAVAELARIGLIPLLLRLPHHH